MNYIRDPLEIERRSFEIIGNFIDESKFGEKELKIIKRVIHATADFEFADILKISDGAIEAGLMALKEGCTIVTDTRMVEAGVSKKALKKVGAKVKSYIDLPDVEKIAKEEGITRSMAAMIKAVEDKSAKIFAIGNAPTALFKLCELVNGKKIEPSLIIGVPVGFVGAEESKEEVKKLGIPYIITEGRKGGSTVAVAIVNALLYML
ncbi:precorrin-8X methylmutase [Caldanaerobacter subterraneus subsp. yonseiensis KB-1]|uniref:Precorrin-8X methylmutase n=1 Tax=Caldanaerobacter subterraneus subsp. yonseiensis KB-1 TaxID=1388761 RepID=U5CLB3_CALSX|nr:precorrin-8X methylmutase [Caldanaerobacter subterraneus]ERM90783.1 precorrin-8X methylmutase [Caldanaerobacter subterraneus subsp. yonseiensis KB-1]